MLDCGKARKCKRPPTRCESREVHVTLDLVQAERRTAKADNHNVAEVQHAAALTNSPH